MASPDWSDYVDLTIYDKDARDIFNESIDYGRDLLPEWLPQAGNIEVVLLESMASQAISVIAAANRVPGAVMETLLALYEIDRDAGTKAVILIDVTLINTTGYVIPAETNFAYFPVGGAKPIAYTLDEDMNIPSGESSGTGTATAIVVGTESNNPPVSSALQVLSTMPYVSSSTLSSRPTAGKEPETDNEFFARASTTLRSYSGALTTPIQIQSWILVTYPDDVYRCYVYDLRRKNDRDITSATYDTHDGYALVVVADINASLTDTSDTQLTIDQLNSISDDLDLKTNTGLVTELVNAEMIDISVDVDVMAQSGYTSTQVSFSVTEALKSYLTPNAWDWSGVLRANEVISLIDNVEGVDHVISLNSLSTGSADATVESNGDITFHILGTLPVSDTHTITVSTP